LGNGKVDFMIPQTIVMKILTTMIQIEGVSPMSKAPHTHTILPSVLTVQLITAQLDRECVENSVHSCS
jgi:hypothetical protein